MDDDNEFAASTGWSRRRLLLLAAVVVVVALVAGGVALLASSGDDDASLRVPPTSDQTVPAPSTTGKEPTTTLAALRCDVPGDATLEAKSGAQGRGPPASASLGNVQAQVSDCASALVFLTAPPSEWEVAYDSSRTALRVKFSAVLSDLAFTDTYGGPYASTEMLPAAPWRLGAVTLLGDDSGVLTWSIDVGAPRPFVVDVSDGALTVEIFEDVPRPFEDVPRAVVCAPEGQHFSVTLPGGWYAEVSPLWAPCRGFYAEPTPITPATESPLTGVRVSLQADPPSESQFWQVLSSVDEAVAGRAGTVSELESNGEGLFPEGAREYRYVVDWGPYGFLVLSTVGMPGPEFDADKAGLDAIAATLQYTE
jgi:hypothetical protein